MKIGVLINSHSRRNRKRKNPLPEAFQHDERFVFEYTSGHHVLPEVLGRMAAKDVGTIVISGGDGTVQSILTELAEARPFKTLPKIVLLPHGTTNMTALDVGLTLKDIHRLPDLLEPGDHTSLTIRKRPTVQIDNCKNTGTQHGMFLGSGGLYRAVVKTHKMVLPLGFAGEWVSAVGFAASLTRALLLRNRFDENRVFQPTPMKIVADGALFADGDQFAMLVTTLDKLVLKSRPFWNQSGQNLRMTTVGFPVPNLVRSTLQIMYGRNRDRLDPEIFRSTSARTIELSTTSPFTLDGEYLEMPEDGPLKIRRGPEFDFICGTL